MSERIVVEISKRGKLFVGEPYFTPGTPIVLDRKGLDGARQGDLAVVRPGKGRARLEKVVGPAPSLAAVLEALMGEEGLRRPFEPYDRRPPAHPGRRGGGAGPASRTSRRRRRTRGAPICGSSSPSRSIPTPPRTSTTPSPCVRKRRGSAPGCTLPTCLRSSRPARRSTSARR